MNVIKFPVKQRRRKDDSAYSIFVESRNRRMSKTMF